MRPYFTSRLAPLPKAALPYPKSETIKVFLDDGQWPDQWYMRPGQVLRELFVVRYDLPLDERGDCDMTYRQWCAFADELLASHPGCCFFYVS